MHVLKGSLKNNLPNIISLVAYGIVVHNQILKGGNGILMAYVIAENLFETYLLGKPSCLAGLNVFLSLPIVQ